MYYRESYPRCYDKKEPKEKKEVCVEINIICKDKEHCPELSFDGDEKDIKDAPVYDKGDPGREKEDNKDKSCVVININCDCKKDKKEERG